MVDICHLFLQQLILYNYHLFSLRKRDMANMSFRLSLNAQCGGGGGGGGDHFTLKRITIPFFFSSFLFFYSTKRD